ncbi:hypothetical protein Ddye_004217 [Dipteronia dyeriana]|uniref:F-box domain-containing protein n=1 Tax=Dipteronia dyeriana TaxID=168575 RepID=A0AAD9XUE7_9ROSI|nr:hypothetical protein Ddye_004217 [Dipteronia dyeriana]
MPHMKKISREGDMGKKDFSLPDDVMIHIFLRFSVKDLSQLRCVCKSWNQLITNQSFVESHINQSTSKACILYHPPGFQPLELGLYSETQDFSLYPETNEFFFAESQTQELSLYFRTGRKPAKIRNPPFATELMDWNIIGSCNGVLCLCSNSDRSLIYMWNPSISKHITLPRPFYKYNIRYLGFGVDHLSGHLDDFKVVTISTNANAEVYSLQKNSWKIIPEGFPPSIELSSCPRDHPVFVKGCVHWCARVSCYLDSKCPWLIVSFDFVDEVFQKIMLPNDLSTSDGAKLLNVVNGCLCVFAAVDEVRSVYELWVMKEYGVVESWTRTCIIEKPDKYWWPLGFTRTGGIFAQGLCVHGDSTLLTYQPDTKTFTCSCFPLNLPHIPIQVLTFVESLVAPIPHLLVL